MEINETIIEGQFVEESKNRFLCLVNINGVLEECYVPNSSRMENYLKLNGKTVLLTLNKNRNGRTKYSLFAVKYYGKLILLNLNLISSILHSGILTESITSQKYYKHYKERVIHNYKTDLLLVNPNNEEDNIIVEAKGIISVRSVTIFPQVKSDRAIKQLMKINQLLKEGVRVHYLFISLSPIVKKILIKESLYSKLLKECIGNGLVLKGISISLEESLVKVHNHLVIEHN